MTRITPFLVIVPFFLFWSCDEDELAGKNFDYNIHNESDIEIGIKVTESNSPLDFTILESTFRLKPGEEVTFLKSSEQKALGAFILTVEVLDSDMAIGYKLLDLSSGKIDGNVTRFNVWMPSPNAREIAKNSTGVTV